MPKQLEQIPDNLKYLIPETGEAIVVGTKAYTVVPLAEGEFESVVTVITEVLAVIVKDILSSAEKLRLNGGTSEEAPAYIDAMKRGIAEIIQSGKIAQIIAIATGLDVELIRKEATLKQLHHFASVFWKQNFSFEGADIETSKNFNRLLAMMGFGQTEARLYQWAEASLAIMQNPQHGSPAKRINLVLQGAYEFDLLQKRPDLLPEETTSPIPDKGSTPTLQENSGSTGTTLTENDSSPAN